MTTLRRIPVLLILVGTWLAGRFAGLDFGITSPAAWVVVFAFGAGIAAEFYKSADILIRSFEADVAFAFITTVAMTASITFLWAAGNIYMTDAIVIGVVSLDAVMSPINSFRSAQRNLSAGIGAPAADPQ